MIYIKKGPAPKFLNKKGSKWQVETKDALDHYKKFDPNDPDSKPFKFKAYNDPAVKKELKKYFFKCAYCETNYSASYDGDIEHFRPKGQVSEKNPKSPGYYWLANDWNNFLLSCQHCNQRRKHQLYGEEKLKAYGKLDQFPIKNEKKRVLKPGSLKKEEKERLLINPCIDNPVNDFQYDKDEAVMIPLTERAKISSTVFVLQRVFLVKERKKKMKLLFRQIGRVKRELERLADDKSKEQKAYYKAELDDLIAFTEKKEPYAGMSRYFVKKFLSENKIKLK